MASVTALRALLGASLGLGTLDLVWLDLALAPEVVERAPAAHASAPAPAPSPTNAASAGPAPADAPRTEPVAASASPPADAAVGEVTTAGAVAEPAPPVAPRAARVYFATRSAALDHRAREALRRVAAVAGTDGELVLEGHADHRGDERLNDELSRQRAVAVEAYLVGLGVARAQIRVGYVGEAEALDTELWRDRRVDIQISGGPR